jgi:hypothetical protein
MDLLSSYMDPLAIAVGVAALILGFAIGWLVARSRSKTTIAELNTKLVLERRVNKQLHERVQVDAMPSLMNGDAMRSGTAGSMREPMPVSG